MLKSVITSAALALGGVISSGAVDYNALEVDMAMNPSRFRELMERFESADTTLTDSEVAVVYYGFTLGNDYNPLENGDEVVRLVNEGKIEAATEAMADILIDQPASLALLTLARSLTERIPTPDTRVSAGWETDTSGPPLIPADLDRRGEMLVRAIFESGKGTNPRSPIFVASSADMDAILRIFLGVSEIVDRTRVGEIDAVKVILPGHSSRQHILYFDNTREELFLKSATVNP